MRCNKKLSVLRAVCFLMAALHVVSSNATAEVYKHINKSGEVKFSDQPFQYKQPTVRQENRNRRLRPGWIKSDNTLVVGKWHLFATSDSKNGKLTRQLDTWNFHSDGRYSATSISSDKNAPLRYFFNAGHIEIQYGDGRDTYSVIDLSKRKMVLRLNDNNQYYYLERNKNRSAASVRDAYYARKQVASIVGLIACGEIDSDISSGLELEEMQKKIFLKTGVTRFNKKKFFSSVDFYKKDGTFKDIYEPKINAYIKGCMRNGSR